MTKIQNILCALGVILLVVGVLVGIHTAEPTAADRSVARTLDEMELNKLFQPEVECEAPSGKSQRCRVWYSDLAELPVQDVTIESSERTAPFKLSYAYSCHKYFDNIRCSAKLKSGLNPSQLSQEDAAEKVAHTIKLARAAAQTKVGTQFNEGVTRFNNHKSYER